MSELDDEALIEALEHAERAQLIEEVRRPGLERFVFAHALIPAILRDSVSGLRRHRLHRRAAAALEELRPDDLEACWPIITAKPATTSKPAATTSRPAIGRAASWRWMMLRGTIAKRSTIGRTRRRWGEPIRWTGLVLALPLIAAQFAFTVGIGAFLAAIHVVLRDVEQALGLVLMGIFYATPIVYPLALVPEPWRGVLAMNPLAYVVGRNRDLFLGAGWLPGDFGLLAVSIVVLMGGLWVVRRITGVIYFNAILDASTAI